jgi:serine/threonine protein kinase
MPEEMIELDPKTEAVFKKKGYKVQKKLSQGAFGQVYKGINTNTDELCAVKVMDLDKVGEKFEQKFLPRELAALIGVKHENVIFIHDIIRANHKIYIFMEFASNGDIAGYLQKNGALKESLACYWFAQITDALKFTHEELHMAHRDIKIDNILLNDKNIAKLTDFGFAKEVWDEKKHKVIMSETFCGTEPYYSPQIVARKPYNPFCADVWAMGVSCSVCLTTNSRFISEMQRLCSKNRMTQTLYKPDLSKGSLKILKIFSKDYSILKKKRESLWLKSWIIPGLEGKQNSNKFNQFSH